METTLISADDLFRYITTYEIDCDAVQNSGIQVTHIRTSGEKLEQLRNDWTHAGTTIDTIEGGEVEKLSGSPEYVIALQHEKGGYVHPLSLTHGYAMAAQSFGARIFCGHAVTRIVRDDSRQTLTHLKTCRCQKHSDSGKTVPRSQPIAREWEPDRQMSQSRIAA